MFIKKKIFKTKRGKIITDVSEVYLRDDIPFGSSLIDAAEETHKLDDSTPHYLIFDFHSVVFYLSSDTLQASKLRNIIIPQTVAEMVKETDFRLYRRLRKLCTKPGFYLLPNLYSKVFHVPTFGYAETLVKVQEEYQKRLPFPVYIITSSRRKLQDYGDSALLFYDYLENHSYIENPVKDAPADIDEEEFSAKTVYPPHMPREEALRMLNDPRYVSGVFSQNPRNFFVGSVMSTETQRVKARIRGRININRALDGDTVLVRLADKEEEDKESAGSIDDLIVSQDFDKDVSKVPEGARVVCILSRRPNTVLVGAVTTVFGSQDICLVKPLDTTVPNMIIKTRQAKELVGKRIKFRFLRWDADSFYPQAQYLNVLGDVGDREVESLSLLITYNVKYEPFTKEVLDCLPLQGDRYTIPPEEIQRRRDLRDVTIFSIDPEGCQDIDDALHIIKINDNLFQVGVHIADVTHFVRENTAIDLEARDRATTVYLVDRRIDMLPQLLAENLCSLRGGQDRLAFSVIFELDRNGVAVSEPWYGRTVIRSRAELSYSQAQSLLDSSEVDGSVLGDVELERKLAPCIKDLNRLAKQIRSRRMENGALELSSAELHFELDSETKEPLSMELYKMRDVNHLIEEFMLLANYYVARKIYRSFPDCALLRRHPPPREEGIENLNVSLRNANLPTIDLTSSRTFSLSLSTIFRELSKRGKGNLFGILKSIATRSMSQAIYYSTGTVEKKAFHHYGLAMDFYTHFTSPIRRYADVVVHRQLAAAIKIDEISPVLLSSSSVESISQNINFRHRMAQLVSRESAKLHSKIFFERLVQEKGPEVLKGLDGVVTSVKANAMIVFVQEYGVDGIIYHSDIASDFVFDPKTFSVRFPASGRRMSVFDKVKVDLIPVFERGKSIKLELSGE